MAARTLPDPPFRVRTAGHVRGQPHHSTPGTKQGDVMLTAFLAGRAHYLAGGRRLDVGAGMVGLVPPQRPGILLTDPADPDDHYYCRFGGAYAHALAARVRAERGGRFFAFDRCEELADLVRRMGRVWRRELPGRMGREELLLAGALVLLAEPAARAAGRGLTAAALEGYLRERVAEPVELSRIAAHFALSRTSLCRRARALTGRTVLELAESIKIEWARTLLASGAANVSEAAQRVGYADPFYFSRVFRKRTGRSPRAWMRARPR